MAKQKKSKDIPGVPDGTPTFKRPLPVDLTDEELKKKGHKAAKIADEVDVLTAELKADGAAKRGEIAQKRTDLRKLLQEMSTGTEDRDVVCYEQKDFNRGEIRVVRSDTAKTVESRTMDAADRQESMPYAQPKRGGGGKQKKPPALKAIQGGNLPVPSDADPEEDSASA